MKYIHILLALMFLGSGCGQSNEYEDYTNRSGKKSTEKELTHFSNPDPRYRFSGVLPDGFEYAYVDENESINIYLPDEEPIGHLDKSQIFIRFFQANQFLTLNTVTIHNKKETSIQGHDAVIYDIEKKNDVAKFPNQPFWRNERHTVTDIKFSEQNPTYFYVFAKHPDLQQEIFDEFLNNLEFHNDKISRRQPMPDAPARITKKPFGIFIDPETSPIQPERFSGYHTGADYEVAKNEINKDVPIFAICGGQITQKIIVEGYDGVITQECLDETIPYSVVYGHVNLTNIQNKEGDYISPGQTIAILGNNFSDETDNERKHLHLSIVKNISSDLRGYISNQSQLQNWFDPAVFLYQ